MGSSILLLSNSLRKPETRSTSHITKSTITMAGAQTTLDAAATDRKARLAKLASLKRKQPGSDTTVAATEEDKDENLAEQKTDRFLSGRNYDVATRGPKLGFENAPATDMPTIEQQAEQIAIAAAEQAAKDEAESEKAIDLFKLQPKKPNWDLKRDLGEKMKVVDVRTQNAIARLVRERIENSKKEALQKEKGKNADNGDDGGEEVGIEGASLVEGVHQREKKEEEDERREKELENEEDGIV